MTVPVRQADSRRPLEVWEPFGTEPGDPIAEMRSLAQRFSDLVDELTRTWPTDGVVPGMSAPLGELEDQDDAYLVRVELPGVKRGDIDVELAGRRLTVRAERKEVQRKGLLRRSTRRSGGFFFEVLLPGEVEQADIEATLEEGVLAVRLPKPESERRRTHKVTIR
jgi:HSP20 family protein